MVSEQPHSIEIEREIISAVLVSCGGAIPERSAKAIEVIEPEDFHDHKHRAIWRAMVKVYQDGKPPGDLALVLEALAGGSVDVGAARKAIGNALDAVGVSSNLPHYTSQLKAYRARREIIDAAVHASSLAYESDDLEAVVDEVERKVYAATRRAVGTSSTSIGSLVRVHDERMQDARQSDAGINGIRTGLRSLDQITGGLQPGWVVLVLAQSGIGKTAFAVGGLALSAARAGHRAHVFSLEQRGDELAGRLVAGCSGVPLNIQRTQMGPDDFARYTAGLDEVASLPITIDDENDLTADQLRLRARRAVGGAERTPMVVIDYVTLLASNHPRESEVERLAHAAKVCKAMALELDAVVVLLAQPTTSSSREGRALFLEDVKGSQSLAAVADLALVPFRPWVYDKARSKNDAELHVRKFRHGDPNGLHGTCFRWNGARMMYQET